MAIDPLLGSKYDPHDPAVAKAALDLGWGDLVAWGAEVKVPAVRDRIWRFRQFQQAWEDADASLLGLGRPVDQMKGEALDLASAQREAMAYAGPGGPYVPSAAVATPGFERPTPTAESEHPTLMAVDKFAKNPLEGTADLFQHTTPDGGTLLLLGAAAAALAVGGGLVWWKVAGPGRLLRRA